MHARCRAMGSIKDLDSTAIYAYTTLISVLICVPAAAIFEGPYLKAAADKAAAAHPDFYMSLFLVGLLYHLYNQASGPLLAQGWPASHPPATLCRDKLATSLYVVTNPTLCLQVLYREGPGGPACFGDQVWG